jgi:hypothetical protein
MPASFTGLWLCAKAEKRQSENFSGLETENESLPEEKVGFCSSFITK